MAELLKARSGQFDVTVIARVNLASQGLRSLRGIEDACNIRALNITDNSVRGACVPQVFCESQMHLLPMTDFDRQVSDLAPLRSLENLTSLDIARNRVESLGASWRGV